MNLQADAKSDTPDWSTFVNRYKNGEWRATIFRDMVLADIKRLGATRELTLLDIGCGKGFDDEPEFQTILGEGCHIYLGVEPDEEMSPNPVIQRVYRCLFEDAPIEPSSVDVAYSVMVLEHLETPEVFWDKLYTVLSGGGVFWGFTIDSRNSFAKLSLLTSSFGIKDWYLDRLQGKKGEERYENYAVFYRSNRPEQIDSLASRFRSTSIMNFHRIGQLDYYLPRPLRWLGRSYDRYLQCRGLPGSLMAIRVEK